MKPKHPIGKSPCPTMQAPANTRCTVQKAPKIRQDAPQKKGGSAYEKRRRMEFI